MSQGEITCPSCNHCFVPVKVPKKRGRKPKYDDPEDPVERRKAQNRRYREKLQERLKKADEIK